MTKFAWCDNGSMSTGHTRTQRLVAATIAGLVLTGLTAPSAHGYRLGKFRWAQATLRYYDGTGGVYRAPSILAARAWTRSRALVRFRRVGDRALADIVISMQPGRPIVGVPKGQTGKTTLQAKSTPEGQFLNHAAIMLPPALGDPAQRRARTLTLAHELGHVLGLAHEDRACAVMNSLIRLDGGCTYARLTRLSPTCKVLTRDDVTGAIALYGQRLGTALPRC